MDARPAEPTDRPAFSALCAHLQSKKTFFLSGPPLESSDVLDASGHCWCRITMQAVGPDGEVVDPEDCRRSRPCFASIL